MQEFSPLDGAILIDKPAGPTSHDVVDIIRRHFGIKKVGHCGTLDPNATGLLIIVLVPWVGVPLYLLLGGRKLRRLAEEYERSGGKLLSTDEILREVDERRGLVG